MISYHNESSGSDDKLELDTKKPYSILETWDKGKKNNREKKKDRKGTFQVPPRKKLKLTASNNEKELHKKVSKNCSEISKQYDRENVLKVSPSCNNLSKKGYPIYKRMVYKSMPETEKKNVSLVRKKIIKGWENLSSEKKDKYINDALSRKENCEICEQDEIDSSSDEVNWVSYNECKRYHAKCVHIDSFYA